MKGAVTCPICGNERNVDIRQTVHVCKHCKKYFKIVLRGRGSKIFVDVVEK